MIQRLPKILCWLLLCVATLAQAQLPVQTLDKVTLQLKWHHQFQFAGYYAAQAQGYYREAGLKVQINPAQPDRSSVEEVLSGRAEFGVGSTDLLLLRQKKQPVVVLASVFQHSAYVLLAMRRAGIESVHDLVGKKVMVDPFATEVIAYLRTVGVPMERVQLVEAHDYTYEALVRGQADAYAGYVTNDPFYLDQVGANYLSFLPRSAGIDFYGDNLFTTESQIQQHPERVAAFRQASLKGWNYAVAHPDRVIDYMIEQGWATPADRAKLRFEAEKTIQLISPELVEIGYMHEGRWRHVLNVYADLGMLPRTLSLNGFLYGKAPEPLPVWVWLVIGLLGLTAFLGIGFAAYVHWAKERLQVQVEQRARAENAELKLASAIYHSLGEALLITDAQDRIVSVNQAFSQMTGYEASELIGRHPGLLFSESDSVDLLAKIQAGLTEAGQWSGAVELIGKDGRPTPKHFFKRAIKGEDGVTIRHVCTFSSIEHDKSKDDVIWNSVHLDPITGLPNRTLFLKTLRDLLNFQPLGSSHSLVVLMLDVDRFQEVNEVLGHHVGDQVLAETALRLRGCLGEQAFLARFGGDEFAIVMPAPENPSLLEVTTQGILAAMAEPFRSATLPFYLSASIGIARYPHDTQSVEQLVQSSEQAMYVAKEKGRNRRVYFSSTMQESALERVRLTNDLRSALASGELFLEYQPIVSFTTGTIAKAEALMRWRHPIEGLVSPVKFIPLAERSGLIVAMGHWAFQQACQQLAVWRQKHPLQLSINKSPLEFHTENGPKMGDLECLQSIGLPGDAVAVEITEGLLLDTSGGVGKQLKSMREAGVHLSLDDFGTGYSSMAYLQKIDISFLKIDRAFVRDLETNTANQTLCRAIIMMAHGLNIQVIAEGVETRGQADLLASLECDYGQGYYFARPVSPEAFGRLLEEGLSVSVPIKGQIGL